MDPKKASELTGKIHELQTLMRAFATDGRTGEQPGQYRELYEDVSLELEDEKFANPNPHKSLELFFAYCGLAKLDKWKQRRAYVDELYADVLLDLKRAARNEQPPKNWVKANDVLSDSLTPVRMQWLKAKNFCYAPKPDFENSIKESIGAVESTLMILLDEPNGTLGKLVKKADLDPDIERLIAQAYGFASNKDFVRHGGTQESTLTRSEAEFFLDFSAASIVYLRQKIVPK